MSTNHCKSVGVTFLLTRSRFLFTLHVTVHIKLQKTKCESVHEKLPLPSYPNARFYANEHNFYQIFSTQRAKVEYLRRSSILCSTSLIWNFKCVKQTSTNIVLLMYSQSACFAAYAMRGHLFIFDHHHQRMQWKPHTCHMDQTKHNWCKLPLDQTCTQYMNHSSNSKEITIGITNHIYKLSKSHSMLYTTCYTQILKQVCLEAIMFPKTKPRVEI